MTAPIRHPRAAMAAELGVGAVAVAANLGHTVLPPGGRLVANLGAAAAAVAVARRSGASWDELGLGRDRVGPGLVVGLGAAAVLTAAVVAASRVPRLRGRFVDAEVSAHGSGRAAYEMGARIPLETAWSEEVLFRGALLGTAMASRSPRAALASTSALFGLWHVVPTVRRLDGSAVGAVAGPDRRARIGAVAGVVGATAVAGAAFGALRLRSGSLVAPVLAHGALNVATFAVSRSVGRRG